MKRPGAIFRTRTERKILSVHAFVDESGNDGYVIMLVAIFIAEQICVVDDLKIRKSHKREEMY